MLSSSFSSIAG